VNYRSGAMRCPDLYFIKKEKRFTASISIPELCPSCLLAQEYYQGEPETHITKDMSRKNTSEIKSGLGFSPFRETVRLRFGPVNSSDNIAIWIVDWLQFCAFYR